MEFFNNEVDDRSRKIKGGKQKILTNDGYVLPLTFKDDLPYFKIWPFTDK